MATIITFDPPHFGVLKLDACLSQQHGRSADITRHKVETGAEVTDHIRPGAYTLSVNGIIAYAPPRDVLAVALGAFTGDANRHVKAFERLQAAIDRSELVTVDTGLRVYKNMAIKSLDSPREVKTGYDFVFTLQLEEVRFVGAATIKIPASALGKLAAAATAKAKTVRQATPAQSKGAGAKSTPTASQTSRGQSLLSTFTGFGG